MKGETHIHTSISTDTSAVIQRWVRENKLIKNGKPWSLPIAAKAILEDFADVLIKDEDILLNEEKEMMKKGEMY